jgi:hypothetical protein
MTSDGYFQVYLRQYSSNGFRRSCVRFEIIVQQRKKHSLQCPLAVLAVWFVSHRTVRVHKVTIFEARNSKDINNLILYLI